MMTPVISEEPITPKNLKTNSITTKLESAKTGDPKIDNEIDKIISHIDRSLADELWIDQTHLDSDEGKKVFHDEHTAVKHMQKEINKKDTPESVKQAFEEVMNDLVEADRILAITLLDEVRNITIDDPEKQTKIDHEISKAEEEYSKGLEEITNEKPDKAIKKFEKTWQHAYKAVIIVDGYIMPTVTILTPEHDYWDENDTTIFLSGVVEDVMVYMIDHVNLNINGVTSEVPLVDGAFGLNVTLTERINNISVSAEDDYGNAAGNIGFDLQ